MTPLPASITRANATARALLDDRFTTVRAADGTPLYRRPTLAALADGLNDSALWENNEPRRLPV